MKFPILAISPVIVAVSCKKTDFKEESGTELTAGTALVQSSDTVGWKAAATWETADQETFSVHYVTIEDATITTDVADNGLVLLFKKSGDAITALPFEEGSTEAASGEAENTPSKYWYHQVAEGSLLISCDAYNEMSTPDVASRFKYFVITPEKLQSLHTDGYTTEKLMNLSYAEASSLLAGLL